MVQMNKSVQGAVQGGMQGVGQVRGAAGLRIDGAAGVDLEAVKARQRAMWASGDFSVVASRIVMVAEQLCETVDVQAGWGVLDVATGSGNAALAAARRGCEVVGVDYVSALLERGRVRAAAEHLSVEFVEGDAEALPVWDGSFDAVLSVYGVMFAPDQKKAASELLRVCKPGGKIGLASWMPRGMLADMFKIFAAFIPPAKGLTPPMMWGDEDHLKGLLGDGAASITSHVRTAVFRFRSAEENVAFFRKYYGPTLRAFESLDEGKRAELALELAKLARVYDRNGGTGAVASCGEYLETVVVKS